MTTSPVMTLTDELLAELEDAFMLGWNESGEGWNAEYPQTDEAAEMVMLAAKRRAMDSALIARVRELEKAQRDLLEAVDSMRGTYGFIAGATHELEDFHLHDKWAEEFLHERAEAARAAIGKSP